MCGLGRTCLLVLVSPQVSLAFMTLESVINWAIEQHGETVTWKPHCVRLGLLFLTGGTENLFLYVFKLLGVMFNLG